jgi:signal transduction histidine kinase
VYRWFLSRAMPVHDEHGQVARWFGSSTEVHEQKLAEQALRRSDKLAAMGRLAASVAHEINNPLASVTNALYLARIDESLSETTRGFLDLADQELTRVAQVATQTLRFYKQSTAPAVVDVGQIVEQVVAVYAARLRGLSVEVSREYGEDLMLYCLGDELRQVFANLISNALDAMADGGRLRVRVRRAGRRGMRVLVADTGSGIPAEVVPQIFEPFVSTKADTGTGLGLWVSDGIVRKHGGKIAVRSCTSEGRHGTVFAVFLPADGLKGGERAS